MKITPKSVVIDRDGGRMRFFWGPKCAVLAGLVKPRPECKPARPPTAARAREFAGQADWIEESRAESA
jgi:hypothetical protein